MTDKLKFRVSAIEVRAARPKAADSRKLQYVREATGRSIEEVVYIVKLYLEELEPFASPLGVRLFVGDNQIKKYSGFRRGIYFKIHDPEFLTRHAGDRVRFTIDGVKFIDSGATFPDVSADAEMPVKAAMVAALPSQEQVLSE